MPPHRWSVSNNNNNNNYINFNCDSLLCDLQTTVISLTSFDWSRCLIKDQFLLSLIAMEQVMTNNSNTMRLFYL